MRARCFAEAGIARHEILRSMRARGGRSLSTHESAPSSRTAPRNPLRSA